MHTAVEPDPNALLRLMAAVAAESTRDGVANTIANAGPAAFGADVVAVAVRDTTEPDVVQLHQPDTHDPAVAQRWARVADTVRSPLTDVFHRRELIACLEPAAIVADYPDMVADLEVLGLRAIAALPALVSDGAVQAAIGLGWNDPPTAVHRAVLEPIAAMCGAAIQRAWAMDDFVRSQSELRAMEREHRRVAERFQDRQLPTLDPVIGGCEVATRYRSAEEALSIGGDWYDMAPFGAEYAIVIGDVVGHDLDAAVTMSQLRQAILGVAETERDPALVLEAIDHAARERELAWLGSTAFVAIYDPASGSFRYSVAGHPPPCVVSASGVRPLDAAPGPPLGVGAPRSSSGDRLTAGEVLFCFTDGLVDVGNGKVTDGFERLHATLAAVGPAAPDIVCDHVLASLPTDGTDDVALLVLRRQRS